MVDGLFILNATMSASQHTVLMCTYVMGTLHYCECVLTCMRLSGISDITLWLEGLAMQTQPKVNISQSL